MSRAGVICGSRAAWVMVMLGKGGGEWSHVASEETGGEKEEEGRMVGCWGISPACFFSSSSSSFRERFWLGKKEKERGGLPLFKKKEEAMNDYRTRKNSPVYYKLCCSKAQKYTFLPGMS